MLIRTTMPSPIGVLSVIADGAAIVALCWDTDSSDRDPDARNPVIAKLGDIEDVEATDHAVLATAVEQLDQYFAGDRVDFDLPLDPRGTAFQRQAWMALRGIPFGETITYGEQALRMGDKNKARAVGAANGQNPIPIVVPCHRVIGSTGHPTGFAGGIDTKLWLLDHELRSISRRTPQRE